MPRAEDRHFQIEELTSGVFAAIATPSGYGLCNAGIVDLGGQTVVFDSMLTPMAGAALARAAERCTGRTPSWVVNSHWHGDHIWGNAEFTTAHVISTRRVRELVLQKSQDQFRACRREFPAALAEIGTPGSAIGRRDWPRVRGWFGGVLATPTPLRVVAPEVTFEEELVLTGSRRSVRLLSYGGGHSPSDVFAFLPDERILFAGDLTMVGLHPSVSDGWPDRWDRILGRVQRLRPDRVLPGHGRVGSAAAIATERTYLQQLERTAAAARRRGVAPAGLGQLPIPAPFRSWGFSFMYPDNLLRAYRLAAAPRRPKRPG